MINTSMVTICLLISFSTYSEPGLVTMVTGSSNVEQGSSHTYFANLGIGSPIESINVLNVSMAYSTPFTTSSYRSGSTRNIYFSQVGWYSIWAKYEGSAIVQGVGCKSFSEISEKRVYSYSG